MRVQEISSLNFSSIINPSYMPSPIFDVIVVL